jgi:threonine aldolase
VIDQRSDTVTRPTTEMRAAMAGAEVGDDVWGDDPTVAELEATVAAMLGKEAAVFVTSGTQSNLCALLAHCQRGDEYIAGEGSHIYRYEAGGGAVLGSVQPQPVRLVDGGRLDLDHVASVIKPDDSHFARTRLLCIENTRDGMVVPLEHHREAADLARANGLALHLDGARLWNAAVALGQPPAAVAEPFDTISVCLSKGLGAPMGSVLAGSGPLVGAARRWRKMLGGAMRQSGIAAAGGLHALHHHIDRLADDHANAARLAAGLAGIPGITVEGQATNMVFITISADPEPLRQAAAANDLRLHLSGRSCRLVTHLDITSGDIDKALAILASAIA